MDKFKDLIENNKFEEAKKVKLDNDQLTSVFRWSCKNGHLEVAKWLWSLDKDIDIYTDEAFKFSCFDGHLEVAKWLWDLNKDIDIHTDNEFAFKYSCRNGHLEVAKWLWSLNQNISDNNEFAFMWSCINGHLEIAKWLWSLNKDIGIYFQNILVCMMSYHDDNLEVAKWLIHLGAIPPKNNKLYLYYRTFKRKQFIGLIMLIIFQIRFKKKLYHPKSHYIKKLKEKFDN